MEKLVPPTSLILVPENPVIKTPKVTRDILDNWLSEQRARMSCQAQIRSIQEWYKTPVD